MEQQSSEDRTRQGEAPGLKRQALAPQRPVSPAVGAAPVLIVAPRLSPWRPLAEFVQQRQPLKHVRRLREARTVLDAQRPALVLGLGLAPEDALALVQTVRDQRGDWMTPVVLVASHRDDASLVAALDAGANDYLAPPFSQDELRARVGGHLRRLDAAPVADIQASAQAQNQDELRDFMENAPVALHWVDGNGVILWANRAELDLLGYSAEEYIGQPIARFHADPPIIEEILRRLKAGETLHSFEARLRRKDGSLRHVLLSSNVYWENGEFRHTRCFTRDITDRFRAQEALRESQDRLQGFFQAAPIGVAIGDLEGRLVHCNHALERFLGYGPGELEGHSYTELTDERELETERRLFAELIDGQRDRYEREKRYRCRNGQLVWGRLTAALMRDPDGRPRYTIGMVEDITARKQAETRLDVVLSSINDHLVSYDRDWRYTFVNRRAAELLGRPPQELLGRSIWELFPEAVGNQYYQELHQAFAEQREIRSEHYYAPWDVWFENHIYPSAEGVTVFSADITSRKKAAAAAQLNEARYQLIFEHSPVSLWEEDFSVVRLQLNRLQESGVSDVTAHLREHPEILQACLERIRVIAVNQAAIRLCEAEDAETLLARPASTLIEDKLPLLAQQLASFMAGNTSFEAEAVAHTLQGKRLHVTLRASLPSGCEASWDRVVVSLLDVTDRKRAEDALRHSEQQYRSLADLMPAGVYMCEAPSNRVRYFNRRAVEIWGQEPGPDEDTRFCGSYRLYHVDGRPLAAADTPMADVLAGGPPVHDKEVLFERPDGSRVTVLVNIEPVHDAEGRLVGAINVMQDVSKRKELFEALRTSEERYRSLLAATSATVWTTGPDGGFLEPQPSWEALTGQDWEQYRGWGWLQAIHPDDRDGAQALWTIALRKRTAFDAAFRLWHAGSRSYRDYEARAVPIYNEFGAIREWVGTCVDITDRRRAEEALRHSHQQFRELANALPQIVWTARADGWTDWYNERWYQYTDAVSDLGGDESWVPYLHPDDVERTRVRWYECVRTGAPYQIEIRFLDASEGQYRWFLTRAHPIRDAQGRLVKWFGTCTDIHDKKLAEEALRDADRRKDEFLATLAHELRNPLAPLRNGIELLRLAQDDRTVAEQARRMMERQLGQMVRLIDDLLDVSRITRGRLELRAEQVSLADVIRGAVETSRPLIESHGHHLHVELPPEPILLEADLTRLAQVFSNLLNNSARYTAPGGDIAILAERVGQELVVRVRDNGMGIPPEMLPRVFEMFTQVDRSLEKSQGGLGIGLTLVKRLVEMHGGSVAASSAGPGQGSEFVVRLPILSIGAPATGLDAPRPSNLQESLVRQRILVADDNDDAVESLAIMLRLMGHEVIPARDGTEALALALEHRPDVLFLDIGMPGLTGYEVARQLREQPWGHDAVLIALTGWGQDGDRRRANEAGFDLHVVKPIDPAMLGSVLAEAQALRQPRIRRLA